ncbi:porin [Shewanella intestini]|uniref:Porin n=1 Tax=Shewanella intestini TaxID=2017544 RepID=A0ABS5I5H8_9GAMM|nr:MULTISPECIES: porin [Shewanella]MBR9729271.1 porin [Shewanella intestini]MRG35416.1 porin [Shewanella sp. XMDDZSB0408]
MKKTLLSMTIFGLLSATSYNALADSPQIYGRFDMALTHSENGVTTQNQKSGTILENNFSRLGIHGSEAITDNIELLYRAEFEVDSATNEGSSEVFKARSTYLGVKSDLGTLIVGRNDTVMKSSKGTAEAFALTNAAYNRMIAGQDRKADGVTYYSPKIADLVSVNATYLMDDNYEDSDEQQYAVSIVAGDKKMKKQSFYLAAAYNTIGGVDAYRGVAQYKIGNLKLGGLFQNTESQTYNEKEGNSYFFSAVYNLNGVNLKAEIGKDKAGFGKYLKNSTSDYKNATDVDITSLVVGADYRLAKSTLLYTHYARYEGEFRVKNAGPVIDLDEDNIVTVGVRYDF